jgi:hypothetical protein
MSNKNHSCPSCARLCDEAKDKSKRLERKVYAMTIALTSALTLLGKEAVDEIVSIVNGVEEMTGSAVDPPSTEEIDSSAVSGNSAPRTEPFMGNRSTETESLAQTSERPKSNVEGISDPPKASKGLMDVVNGKMPSIGELVDMPSSSMVPVPRNDQDDSLVPDTVSYLEYEIIDPNARFVTDSPFGGYDYGMDNTTLPVPATVALLGIVPMFARRRQR